MKMIRTILIRFSLCGLLLTFGGTFAIAQQGEEVTGRLISTGGKPVSDVTVSFDGNTAAPAVTDSTGSFSLTVPDGNVWLTITPIAGYKSKSVFLNGRKELTIYLAPRKTKSVHDEVLYTGNNRLKRNILVSTHQKVAGEIDPDPWEGIDQKLQGRVSGLYQVGTSGMPGAGTFMLNQGLRSINTNNQPLVIVDGIPLEAPGLIGSVVSGYVNNPLSSIDVMDISSMTVIKGGAPLASYGVNGSNGVILIQTLKPSETTTSIDFQFKTGMNFSNARMPLLNTEQYKSLAKEVLSTSPYPEEEYMERYPGLFYIPSDDEYLRYSHNTPWQEEVFRNTWMQDAYLAVKGGDAIARYGLSVGFMNHKGTLDNTRYNRFNTRFVGTFNVFTWLRMYVSANLVSANSDYKESALASETGALLTAMQKSPQMYPYSYDQDGKLLTAIDDVDELGVSNPRAVMDSYMATNSNYRFLNSFRIEGDITKNLKWNTLLGLNINDVKEQVFMPNIGMVDYLDGEAYNVSQTLNNFLFMLYNDNYLSYTNTFNNIHALDVSGGMRWQTNRFEADWGIARNAAENDQYTTLQSGEVEMRDISGDNGRWNWLSSYVNVSYIFKDRYMLDASTSLDFSSRTGKSAPDAIYLGEQPFGLFYSVGGAWRLSGESFMSGIDILEDLKLKVNYGTSGNDDIGNYSAYPFYILELYREGSGMVPGGYPNRFLSYETVNQISGGLDMSLMENRLMLSAEYYTGKTYNMLTYEGLSSFMGYDIFPSNNGVLERKGYDASIYGRLIQSKAFALDLSLNVGHYSSMITDIAGGEVISDIPGDAQVINRTGEPANSFYGFEYLGVFATQAEADAAGLVNEREIPFRAGDAIFNDVSGPEGIPDQVIDDHDKVILGSATPEYFGGASLDIYFGRFHLDMFWQFAYGNEVYNYLRYQMEGMTGLENQHSSVLNRWTYEGQETDIPRARWEDPTGNSAFSSRWIEDGSYIRLKQLTVSYEIPEGLAFFRNLSVFVTGTNLFTATNYLGFDPEFAFSYNSISQGADYGMMPHGRRVMVGVKFGL